MTANIVEPTDAHANSATRSTSQAKVQTKVGAALIVVGLLAGGAGTLGMLITYAVGHTFGAAGV